MIEKIPDDDDMQDVPHDSSGDEGGIDDDDGKVLVTQRKNRGPNREWNILATYANMENAMKDFTKPELIINEQILGRSLRGYKGTQTIDCKMITCGCEKSWRLSRRDCEVSDQVILEESDNEHTNHHLYVRNGGRGMSADQVEIVDRALLATIYKPRKVIELFKMRNKEARLIDPDSVDVELPPSQQLKSYISNKRKRAKSSDRNRRVTGTIRSGVGTNST